MILGFFLGIKIFSFQRTNLAFPANGGKRDRTDDLLLAKQVLSQLSYAPVKYQLLRCYSISAEM